MHQNFKLFINHNKRNFKKVSDSTKGQILIEFNNWSMAHISASYLGNILSTKHKAKMVGFEGYTLISSRLNLSIIDKFKYYLSKNFFGKYYKVYNSFNVENFIRPSIESDILEKSKKKYSDSIKKISSKEKLLNFKIEGVIIGDLIYDTFLKIKKLPTVDINSSILKDYIYECVQVFYYWKKYFKNNNIKSVIIVHPTYIYGIIMRIACQRNIPVYRAHLNYVEYIKHKNYNVGKQFRNYPKYFKSLNSKNKIELINKSKILLEDILKKKIGSTNLKKFVPKETKNKKISVLIAMHNFYDSPHVFGKMLFPDFYEWLNYLVKISKKTNYKWYLKLHPENDIKDFKFIKKIIGKKGNIEILPSDVTHKFVLKKKIQFVLTCFGTIGYEYAYLGLTVINACKFNPHQAYNFNLNPKNILEYSKIIKNLRQYLIKPPKKEILEFFYIRHTLLSNNCLDIKKKKLKNVFKWQNEIYKPELYKIWVKNCNKKKHNKIYEFFKDFINSKKNVSIVSRDQNLNLLNYD